MQRPGLSLAVILLVSPAVFAQHSSDGGSSGGSRSGRRLSQRFVRWLKLFWRFRKQPRFLGQQLEWRTQHVAQAANSALGVGTPIGT